MNIRFGQNAPWLLFGLNSLALLNSNTLLSLSPSSTRRWISSIEEYLSFAICMWSSGRITLIWEAETADIESALKWAHLAPPNDTKKRAKVEDWLQKRKVRGLPT